jgi:coenzyme PQQ precursor peptide PqqA
MICRPSVGHRRDFGRFAMAWTTPVITETPCGAEINLYVSAEI